jgi:hypothetical protein
VEVRHGEGVANRTGPEARVVREGRREAFTGEGAGEVLSGVRQVRGADVFRPTEGNTAGVDIARHMPTPRRTLACAEAFCTGTGRSPSPSPPVVVGTLSGRPEAVADDEREGEVGPARSSEEASEQSGLGRCGARGAKGRGQGDRSCKARSGRRAGKPCHARRPAYEKPSPGTDRTSGRRSCITSTLRFCGQASSD